MRHFVGFLFGLVLAPVVVLGAGWVFQRLRPVYAADGSFVSASGVVAVAVLGAVVMVVALVLVPPRLTPLLPLSMGVFLVGVTALEVTRPHLVQRLPDLPGFEGAQELVVLGVFLPVALALVVPVFVGSRWREGDEAEADEEDQYLEGLYEDEEGSGAGEKAPRRGRRRRRG